MNYNILWHNALIEIILLILIIIIYEYAHIPKEHMAICLLGTYILMKSITNLMHSFYHYLKESNKK
jgi:hypothetical protein